MDKEEKFTSSHTFLLLVLIGIPIVLLLGFWEQGFNSALVKGFGLFALVVSFIFIGNILTFVSIRDHRTLVSKVGFGRGFKADVYEISRIDRTPAFMFKRWGSRLQIYFLDETGQETWRTIQEAMYDVQTIKGFLSRLKEINPSIKLDLQYRDLLDGNIENESVFKQIPANTDV